MAGFLIGPLPAEYRAQARAVMMRSVTDDLGLRYDCHLHRDIDDLDGTYPGTGGPFMLVAVDPDTETVLATGGVRDGQLNPDHCPEHLVQRYADGRTGQIVRVYTLRAHRRQGIARAVVASIFERVQNSGSYDRLALHTVHSSPGAVPFWQAMGFVIVADDSGGPSQAVFMELGYP